jgi:anti-anti-sigma factor
MGDAQLKISETEEGGFTILHLDGDIDAHTSPVLKDAIDKVLTRKKINIIFDFAKLNYISSAGIGILNAALNSIKGLKGKMGIAGANKTVHDTLEVMYFSRKVGIFPTIGEAVKIL